MKSPLGIFRLIFISTLIFLTLVTSSYANEGTRSCTVKEVIKGGMYVYLRCHEKGKEPFWMATVAREFKIDEIFSFVDAPPMTNFYSKQLKRTFPEIIFTDILPPEGKKK